MKYPYFQVFESIPQIPINVQEIKKIILKDQYLNNDQTIHDEELLNVLTANAKGRNALFFKADGHIDVYGLRSSIPEGSINLLDKKGKHDSTFLLLVILLLFSKLSFM